MREEDGLPLPRRISIIDKISERMDSTAITVTLGLPTQVSEVGPKAMLGDLEKSWSGDTWVWSGSNLLFKLGTWGLPWWSSG